MPLELLVIVFAGILTAAIAVEDQPRQLGWIASQPGHLQRIEHQVAPHIRLHRPAHHFAAKQIDHHCEKQPAFRGWEWSKRQGVVELFPRLSSPNRTCTAQRIRLSVQVLLIAKATPA